MTRISCLASYFYYYCQMDLGFIRVYNNDHYDTRKAFISFIIRRDLCDARVVRLSEVLAGSSHFVPAKSCSREQDVRSSGIRYDRLEQIAHA